jgi:hypothetical protein
VPLPGALSIRTHPPSVSARSCIELSPRWPRGNEQHEVDRSHNGDPRDEQEE